MIRLQRSALIFLSFINMTKQKKEKGDIPDEEDEEVRPVGGEIGKVRGVFWGVIWSVASGVRVELTSPTEVEFVWVETEFRMT